MCALSIGSTAFSHTHAQHGGIIWAPWYVVKEVQDVHAMSHNANDLQHGTQSRTWARTDTQTPTQIPSFCMCAHTQKGKRKHCNGKQI